MTVGQLSQSPDSNCDDTSSEEDSPKRRRDLLTRRPSYHRILKEIGGPDIAGEFLNSQKLWYNYKKILGRPDVRG